jgi:hypothetical protein
MTVRHSRRIELLADIAACLIQGENVRGWRYAFEDDNERGEDHHEGHHGSDDGGHN